MNKVEFKKAIQAELAETKGKVSLKEVGLHLEATLTALEKALANDEKVKLTGFGLFEMRNRAERNGHNPQTGEKIVIPATKTPAFKASAVLKANTKA